MNNTFSRIFAVVGLLVLVFVIIFAQDIRGAIDEYAASHGHPRRVQIQAHGCAVVAGVQYCIDTAEAIPEAKEAR